MWKQLNSSKKKYKHFGIMTDVALDPYTSHGHDGIIINDKIDNDETLSLLNKQALLQATSGSRCNSSF